MKIIIGILLLLVGFALVTSWRVAAVMVVTCTATLIVMGSLVAFFVKIGWLK